MSKSHDVRRCDVVRHRVMFKLCSRLRIHSIFVIPAKAGIQGHEQRPVWLWIPAFAGMTAKGFATDDAQPF